MLELKVIMGEDLFDDERQEFIEPESFTLELEHSLVSLSKWEASWEKPFLSSDKKTFEETLSYVKAMTLTPNVPPEVYTKLTDTHVEQINKYITAKMSATWFSAPKPSPGQGKEIITAEIIYYWMIALNIPLEWENRHLERLLTLIKVCNEKNAPPDKKKRMSRQELAESRRQLNEKRKAQLKTSG